MTGLEHSFLTNIGDAVDNPAADVVNAEAVYAPPLLSAGYCRWGARVLR